MGVAIGVIHLSYNDFIVLTPDEFDHVYRAYVDDREANYRNSWEQCRSHASIAIAPHVKHRLTPQKLMPMPWDSEDKHKERLKASAQAVTKEEALKRLRARLNK